MYECIAHNLDLDILNTYMFLTISYIKRVCKRIKNR